MLWQAFQANNYEPIIPIIARDFPNFKKYDQVFEALFQIETKPKEILREIIEKGETDFNKIFTQFKEKAGVYGFGDSQVKNLLSEI
ncbi:MAG: hypothetical protein HC846_11350 [Blastocatellia bacterium]|nr:hypothetical protein [Blastocatellia bacterium]